MTRIADNFLRFRENLTSVIIPEGVTHVGKSAFCGCSALESVELPGSLIHIGEYAFHSSPWMLNMAPFPIVNGVLIRYLGSEESVVIPEGVKRIGCGAFEGKRDLRRITIPEGVTHIDGQAFLNCTSLEDLRLPDGLTRIGARAFAGCWALRSICIPEGVTHIGDEAFRDCNTLRSATLPDSLTVTGLHLFRCCPLFRHLNVSDSVRKLLKDRHSIGNELSDVIIAIDGPLKHFKNHKAFQQLMADFHGHVAGSVSQGATCLITNDTTHSGRKLEQARKLGISILTEEEFFSRYFPAGIL